jgi:hypothetical protein
LVGGEWLIDTVFVVASSYSYDVINYEAMLRNKNLPLPEGFREVVLQPVCSAPDHVCGEKVTGQMTFYVGATRDNPFKHRFSFFPCQPGEHVHRFKRPALQLRDTILVDYFTTELTQAARGANDNLLEEKVHALWMEVKRQVLKKKLSLGVSADFPERR